MRVEYEKGRNIKYLSHLDMVRAWERLLRRCDLKVKLTQGFNPHFCLSLGTVLPVGVWGKREYLDVELAEQVGEKELLDSLRKHAPLGIGINKLRRIDDKAPSLMAVVNLSSYRIYSDIPKDRLEEEVQELVESPTLVVKTNKGQKDIRPGIVSLKVEEEQGLGTIVALVTAGQKGQVRITDLIGVLLDKEKGKGRIVEVCREANYVQVDKELLCPMEDRVVRCGKNHCN